MKPLVVAVFVVLAATHVSAERIGSRFSRDAVGEKTYPSAPRLSVQAEIAPAVVLPPADTVPELIESVRQWNAEGRLPSKNGIVRSTVDPVAVSLFADVIAKGPAMSGRGYVATTAGGITWSGSLKVERAARLRLHLEEITLPAGTVLWVYGNAGAAIAFDSALVDDRGGLWTPSVDGDTIHLELEIPRNSASASFVIRELLEIVPQALTPASSDVSCLIDAACIGPTAVPKIDSLKAAIAQLEYVKDGNGYVCSGGLLNDRGGTGTPYLLTANHCFTTQSSASSLEATWSFTRASCNGPLPSISQFPRSQGATLLATSATSDFTLVRMNSVPSNRWFLGWDTNAVPAGTTLYRISHPFPDEFTAPLPQSYSTTTVDTTSSTCTGLSRPNFVYSSFRDGATWGGSSGSPVSYLNSDLYVIGQLYGRCGPQGAGDCSLSVKNVDGSFATTYGSIAQWIDAGNGTQPQVCTQNSTTLCLSNDRFAVSATWRTSDGNSGAGQAVRLTSDTGYFWFFNASNVETVLKVLNACSVNSKFWVFAAGLTNVNVVLTIRDVKTGSTKTYTNPLNTAFQPVQDVSAFATCP